MNTSTQFCSFAIGDGLYGIDALRVQEVVQARSTTPVPLAASAVVGLMNLRGQIVTVLDVRKRLAIESPSAATAIVVVQTSNGAIGLLVDEIGDVVDVSTEQMEPPPDTFRGEARSLVVAACKLSARLLVTLDVDKLVAL